MAGESTLAIVLRVTEFSETSCIVTLLTREFGKISAIAKGARRPKSVFEAAIDVLAICRVVVILKPNALSILTEAKLEHRFRAAEWDLVRLYLGFYMVELVKSLTDEGDPHPDLFDFTYQSLRQLESESLGREGLRQAALQYELGLLDLLGQLPMLTRCVDCGRQKTMLSAVDFGLNAGGVLCHSCRRGQSHLVKVGQPAFQYLLSLVGGQVGVDAENSDNWSRTDLTHEAQIKARSWRPGSEISPETAAVREQAQSDMRMDVLPGDMDPAFEDADRLEARRLIQQYITHLIGYPPRLHRFLQNI